MIIMIQAEHKIIMHTGKNDYLVCVEASRRSHDPG